MPKNKQMLITQETGYSELEKHQRQGIKTGIGRTDISQINGHKYVGDLACGK